MVDGIRVCNLFASTVPWKIYYDNEGVWESIKISAVVHFGNEYGKNNDISQKKFFCIKKNGGNMVTSNFLDSRILWVRLSASFVLDC